MSPAPTPPLEITLDTRKITKAKIPPIIKDTPKFKSPLYKIKTCIKSNTITKTNNIKTIILGITCFFISIIVNKNTISNKIKYL